MSQQTMAEKLDALKKENEVFYRWVESFIEEPTRQKKLRIKEHSRAVSSIKNKLCADVTGTSCGWGDKNEFRTSKKNL